MYLPAEQGAHTPAVLPWPGLQGRLQLGGVAHVRMLVVAKMAREAGMTGQL